VCANYMHLLTFSYGVITPKTLGASDLSPWNTGRETLAKNLLEYTEEKNGNYK